MGRAEPRIERILVPTDFSGPAREAFEWAIDMAKHYRSQVTLFHVYQVPGYAFPDGVVPVQPEVLGDLIEQVQARLEEMKASVADSGVVVETVTTEGAPSTEIKRAAKDGGYHLIVMGTHGHSVVHDLLLGSVAYKVVRKAPCPVLTVRSNRPDFSAT